jgi:hypothetical protein
MRLSVTSTAKICPIEIAANISPCVTGKIAQLHRRSSPKTLQVLLVPGKVAHAALDAAAQVRRQVEG